jgi:hypothetical protein
MGKSGVTSTDAFIRSKDKEGLAPSTPGGFYLQEDGKFNFGNTTNFIDWNGSALSIKGGITADTGTVGGFTLSSNTLTAGTTSGNFLGMSPGIGTFSNISFWAGALRDFPNAPTIAQIEAAPFRVTNTGSLTATSGKIGDLSILSTPSIGLSTSLVTNSGRFAPNVNVENYTGQLILRNQEGSFYDKVNTRAGVTVDEERYFNINVYNPFSSPDSTFIPTIEIGTNNVNINSSTAIRTLKIQPHRILRRLSSTEYEYSFPANSGIFAMTGHLTNLTLLKLVNAQAANIKNDTGHLVTDIPDMSQYKYILLRLFSARTGETSNGWMLIPESYWDNSTTQSYTVMAAKDNYQSGVWGMVLATVVRVSNTSARFRLSYSGSTSDTISIFGLN